MDLQPIYAALVAHQWLLAGALFVLIVVAALKQGWLSAWLQAKIQPRYLPFLALGIGIASVMAADIIAGKTWQQALFDGFGAAVAAVFGHQVVVEAGRNGKEIIPPAPWSMKPPPSSPPPDSVYRTPAKPIEDPKSTPPTTSRLAVLFRRRRAWDRVAAIAMVAMMASIPFAISSCTQQGAKTATTVALDLAQMACIEASTLTDSAAVATACKIDQTLTPELQTFLNDLIGQREAAKRSGFHWKAGIDAGAPAESDAGSQAVVFPAPSRHVL